MKIYVISDTHFGHENIYKFTTEDKVTRVRPEFSNSIEGDAEMVRRWNAIVTPQDHVYHLGDVCMNTAKHLALVKYLLGHKRLIWGNHDKGKPSEYQAAGFQKIMGYRWINDFILSHVPLHPSSLGNRINVHGHIHERAPFGEQYRNVSVERINYTPVLLESLR